MRPKVGLVLVGALLLSSIARLGHAQATPDGQWRSANSPAGPTASIRSLAVDPTDSSIAYACGVDGLFKTNTGGAEWLRMGPAGAGCYSLAMDPLHSNVVYIQNMYGESYGLFKTTDAGVTWTRDVEGYGSWVVVGPDSIVYVVSGSRINSSTDGAASWTGWVYLPLPADTSVSRTIAALVVDPAAPARVYAATPAGVYRSLDGGRSWLLPSNTGLTNTDVRALLANGSTVYAGSMAGLFVSRDGGESWTPAGAETAGRSVLSVAARPDTPTILYAAVRQGTTYGILRSSDSGASWTALGSPLSSVSAVYVEPGGAHAIYALGTAAGAATVLRSADEGASWQALNTGLSLTAVWSMAFDPHNPARLFTGENGRIQSVDWPSGTWESRATGLGTIWQLAFAPSAPDQIYAADFCRGVQASRDGGETWSRLLNGLSVSCVEGIVVDPVVPTTVYASTNNGVFKSTNSGDLWTPINNGTSPTSGDNRDFQAIAIDPTSPATLYIGGTLPDYPAFKTTDGGANWTLSQPLPPNPVGIYYVWSIVVDPTNPATVYLTSDGVYKSTDAGATWNTTGLSGKAVRALVLDPVVPNVLYAGLEFDNRVYRSGDGGASWQPLGQGLPPVGVLSLAFDPTGAILFAGTNGEGVYYLPVRSQTGTISVTTNLTSASFTITGPAAYSGGGTSFTRTNAPVGTYSIAYGAVPGYATPPSQTQTLGPSGTISFAGTYAANPPTLKCPASTSIRGCNPAAIGPLRYSTAPVTISLAQLVAAGGSASATCGIRSITYHDRSAGRCPNLVVTRTFTVVDGCGQSTSGQQTIRFGRAPEPKVDLAVVDVTYTAYPSPGGGWNLPLSHWRFYGAAKIANLGNVAAERVVLKFSFPTTVYVTLPRLAAGSTTWVSPRSLTGRGGLVSPGTYTLTVTVDPQDRIPETDESNNVRSMTVVLPREDR